eukprot:maker-scaffold197_size267318-snap-gene-0.12 protein:Tk09452 transcript:maker-scaffold197_size267318-snap-gene-0.12-mRNA-1 annotation:"myelin p2 protein"
MKVTEAEITSSIANLPLMNEYDFHGSKSMLTIQTNGRLGNVMSAYASMYGIARSLDFKPLVDSENKKLLQRYFLSITIEEDREAVASFGYFLSPIHYLPYVEELRNFWWNFDSIAQARIVEAVAENADDLSDILLIGIHSEIATIPIMAEVFLGSWKYVSAENFDEYLKEIGVNAILRKLAVLASPTVIFSNNKPGQSGPELLSAEWIMRTETIVKSAQASFKLNESFRETTIDDRKVTSTFKFAEQKLIQEQIDIKDRVTIITRELEDNNLVMKVTIAVNGVLQNVIQGLGLSSVAVPSEDFEFGVNLRFVVANNFL